MPIQLRVLRLENTIVKNQAIEQLRHRAAEGSWKYRDFGPNATEPAGFACLALNAHGHHNAALSLAQWLAQIQTPEGSVGVTATDHTPAWPTSLALLSWIAMRNVGTKSFLTNETSAVDWILTTKGKKLPLRRQIGHDTTILGWSWAENTHSWLEPTCLFVLALKAAGKDQHQRTRDGIAMIVDRLHADGGCNYGNTIVLGQSTLPHIQPTGLAMLAIAGETVDDSRVDRSLNYLEQSIADDTATASLCFAILGLTAHGRRPQNAEQMIRRVLHRDEEHKTTSCYKLALLALANMEDTSWLPMNTPQAVLQLSNA